MAEAYKNARQAVGTSYATVYTCPANTSAVIFGAQFANVDGSASVTVSAQWLDSSAANVATELLHTAQLAPANAIPIIAGKLVLEAGDAFQAKASASGDAQITLSILEIS